MVMPAAATKQGAAARQRLREIVKQLRDKPFN
jgi:hypothetical protein